MLTVDEASRRALLARRRLGSLHDVGHVGEALGELQLAALVVLLEVLEQRVAVLVDVDVELFEGGHRVELAHVHHRQLLHRRVHLLVGDLRQVGHVLVERRDHLAEPNTDRDRDGEKEREKRGKKRVSNRSSVLRVYGDVLWYVLGEE